MRACLLVVSILFSISSWAQGWSTSRQGYLAPREWVFALAVFTVLRSETTDVAAGGLNAYLAKDLEKAVRYLRSNEDTLARL